MLGENLVNTDDDLLAFRALRKVTVDRSFRGPTETTRTTQEQSQSVIIADLSGLTQRIQWAVGKLYSPAS